MKKGTLIAIVSFPFFLAAVFILFILANQQGERVEHRPQQDAVSTNKRVLLGPTTLPKSLPLGETKPAIPSDAADRTTPASVTTPAGTVRSESSSAQTYDLVLLLIREYKEEEAIKTLNEMIENHPNDLRSYALLGELYYKKDQLREAILAWEKVLEADPSDKKIGAFLEKARREVKTHTEFTHETTRHFTIKFEGAENRYLYRTVLDILEEAYGEVGRTFSFFPSEEVIVFLYTNQQFFDVTRAPSWSGGVFDGKIRIPSLGFENQIPRLRRILFHEYVHAVVHRITEPWAVRTGQTNRIVPAWLHEGIAQYLEPRVGDSSGKENEVNNRLKMLVKQNAFIPLSQMHGSFMGLNNLLAAMAYDESLSAVSFLIDEFGIWRLKMLLEDLSQKGDLDEAMKSALLISYEVFQLRWKETLQS